MISGLRSTPRFNVDEYLDKQLAQPGPFVVSDGKRTMHVSRPADAQFRPWALKLNDRIEGEMRTAAEARNPQRLSNLMAELPRVQAGVAKPKRDWIAFELRIEKFVVPAITGVAAFCLLRAVYAACLYVGQQLQAVIR